MSEKPTKYFFYVYAPDYTDPDGLSRRLSVREKHLANAKVIHAAGLLRTSWMHSTLICILISACIPDRV